MTVELVKTEDIAITRYHTSIKNDFLDRVMDLLKQDLEIKSYGIASTVYTAGETLTLEVGEKQTLKIELETKKY